MATEVKLPELGDGIESGDVLEVFVSVGDVITEGQDVVEMETDKATVPVPASVGGKVTKILVNEGDTVAIGGVILEVEAASGAESTPEPEPAPAKEAIPEPVAEAPQAPTPQAPAAEAPASQAPAAEAPAAEPPQPAAKAPAASEAPPASVTPVVASAEVTAAPQPPAVGGESIAAGPAIRRFAREVSVDLSSVRGTGENGRITREDVLAVVRANQGAAQNGGSANTAISTGPPAVSSGASTADDFGTIRVERMDRMRKTISKQMHASWSSVPRVTNFDDADITDLEQLRKSSKDDYAAQGLKLTSMPFLIKAVATALRHHPTINAAIDQENEQILYKEYVNVGIAVDTERGLVVPVMHNADRMGVPEITRSLAEMSGKVRGGQFAVSDLRGGTFTISNLGAIGGTYSTPIVNVPEVAILLVGRSRKLPVVMPDDSIRPRLMMPLSLSYDHRLVDGGTAARFLNDVIGYLEAPSRLLLAL
ncbi:Dihydrolipoyllysine-residue acetyltransferase component of pyruvate dehydrogenase complex [Planctomycetes bacterium CA13]|uniref:Dihydrolipoamide acetyltransferase component of pyruvate dehydrogenase complex n=1 Tax=Novipirellula herctigrandis TaxID=2527986 RepID=A0A5C5Z9J6_9BACT|nr:Dihydrolipoyllysine-residue acetyltransferase component of pyruvate dehydrogenase complex [Planctomycetes bacterium CA13]